MQDESGRFLGRGGGAGFLRYQASGKHNYKFKYILQLFYFLFFFLKEASYYAKDIGTKIAGCLNLLKSGSLKETVPNNADGNIYWKWGNTEAERRTEEKFREDYTLLISNGKIGVTAVQGKRILSVVLKKLRHCRTECQKLPIKWPIIKWQSATLTRCDSACSELHADETTVSLCGHKGTFLESFYM